MSPQGQRVRLRDWFDQHQYDRFGVGWAIRFGREWGGLIQGVLCILCCCVAASVVIVVRSDRAQDAKDRAYRNELSQYTGAVRCKAAKENGPVFKAWIESFDGTPYAMPAKGKQIFTANIPKECPKIPPKPKKPAGYRG